MDGRPREDAGARRARSSIYEVHLGSWQRKVEEGNGFLSYRELADQLVELPRARRASPTSS